MSAAPSASPLRCAEILRSVALAKAAALIRDLDPRFARLVLATENRLIAEDWRASPESKAHDHTVALLLQVRIGIYDHAIAMGGQCFAVPPEVRPYLDLVAKVRVRELQALR